MEGLMIPDIISAMSHLGSTVPVRLEPSDRSMTGLSKDNFSSPKNPRYFGELSKYRG